MGTQKNRLNETVLLSTQNMCLKLRVRKYLQFHAEKFCLSKPVKFLKERLYLMNEAADYLDVHLTLKYENKAQLLKDSSMIQSST